MVVRVRLLGHLREAVGRDVIEVDSEDWVEALIKVRSLHGRLSEAIDERGEPRPGYLAFVDGVDYRIAGRGRAGEVAILPVSHGGLKERFLSWDDIVKASFEVSMKVKESGFKVETIVGVLRGGIIPATLIADVLGVADLGVLDIKFYQAPGVRRDKPFLRQPLTLPIHSRNVLIVDDVSDTGLTLQLALSVIKHYAPREARSATLYVKPWTKLIPDYYAEITEEWLVFPWGVWEHKRFKGEAGH